MHERLLKVALHLVGWCVFFTLPLILMPHMQKYYCSVFVHDIASQVILVCYFYLNAYVLVPRYLSRRSFLLFGIITLALAFVYVYSSNLMPSLPRPDNFMELPKPRFNHFERHFRPRFIVPPQQIILFLLVFIASTGMTLLEELFTTRKNKQLAENERSRAELSTLKAQINPHFLFNTLNSIYSLALEKSDRTADAIVKLSGLMRYVLTESDIEFTSMATEIEYINRYIELQKLRISDKTTVMFDAGGDFQHHKIAPLLFTPFVENAFKYGVSTREDSVIKIMIKEEGRGILFRVENRIVDSVVGDSTKRGIENVRQRLQLLYPGNHSLEIDKPDGNFVVNLKIENTYEN